MTKKHFIALADHVRPLQIAMNRETFDLTLNSLANFCRSQNSNFNRQRWLDYIDGKCGPNGGKI